MDIFLTQTHHFASKGLYKPPELCGALMHSKTEMAIHSRYENLEEPGLYGGNYHFKG